MARLIFLDSGPLGLMVRAPGKPQVQRCLAWLNAVMRNAAVVVIPEIAHYEVRRELIRIRAVDSLRRLEYALDPSSGFDHLTLTTDAIIKAAERGGVIVAEACCGSAEFDAGFRNLMKLMFPRQEESCVRCRTTIRSGAPGIGSLPRCIPCWASRAVSEPR